MLKEHLYNLATDKYGGFTPAIIKIFLYLISFIYGLLVRSLILFSHLKAYRLNCKVISVGNITLGGTGKTSLVEYIANSLKQQGHKVAILSRGYKRKITNYQLSFDELRTPRRRTPSNVEVPITNYEIMGDEPYMLSKHLGDVPILVDANRINSGKRAIQDYGVDTVILDDGFQQWRINKDLEIVTIDATKPFGNRYLLPRGILREPLSSLKRADIFILTKTNLMPNVEKIKTLLNSLNPKAQIFESIHQPIGFYEIYKRNELLNVQRLNGKTVTLVSGIADPDSFEKLIINLGIKVGLSFRFPDHHRYAQEELDRIIKKSQDKNIDTIVTTEKDAVRLYSLLATRYSLLILYLRIELKIKDEQGFHNRLLSLYSY